MRKYAAAIIANTVFIWAAGAFIAWDWSWIASAHPSERFFAFLAWLLFRIVSFIAASK